MTKRELYQLLYTPDLITAEHIAPLERLTESYPYCSSFIVLYLYALAKTEDVRYSAELKRLVAYLPHRERLYDMINGLSKSAPVGAAPQAREDGFSLIDSFLEDARSMGEDLPLDLHYDASEHSDYFAKEAKHPVDVEEIATPIPGQSLATPPTEPSPSEQDLFTETLARIYIQQGKYERAHSILTTLHLQYPQKNRYFAEQIRYLERLIKNNIDK